MPVHPKEEEAESGLTDKVAKESADSTASDHPRRKLCPAPLQATALK